MFAPYYVTHMNLHYLFIVFRIIASILVLYNVMKTFQALLIFANLNEK